MSQEINNTDSEFYEEWSREQLVEELCRLNQLLLDCLEIVKEPENGS